MNNPGLGTVQLVRDTTTNRLGTVLDDRARDALLGRLGSDWFFDFAKDSTDRRRDDR